MKRFFVLLLSLFFLAMPSMAANRAVVGLGVVKFKSTSGGESVVAANIADQIQITIGGSKGTSSGTLTVFLPQALVASLEKGTKLDVTSTGDESDAEAVNIVFLGTKISINGTNSTTTGVASNNDSQATGQFNVVQYDPETKELKFSLNAKVAPWTQQVTKGIGGSPTTKEVSKPIKVNAQVVVTLP